MTNNSVLQKFFLVYKLEIWETAKELHAYIYSVQKTKTWYKFQISYSLNHNI